MSTFTAVASTSTGRVRKRNEDAVLADMPLIAVADGMGGHAAGDVASSTAIEILASWKPKLESAKDVAATLTEAFLDVNRTVMELGSRDAATHGMGTTLTAGWLVGDTLILGHIGDSRAYLLRGGQLQQLTVDQTVAQQWVSEGKLSDDEAELAPQRHILLHAIGTDANLSEIDLTTVQLQPGDRVVLCSDGLHGVAGEDRMREILTSTPEANAACDALIAAANDAGGNDNITVVLAQDTDAPDAGDPDAPIIVTKPTSGGRRFRPTRRQLLLGGAVAGVALLFTVILMASSGPSYLLATRDGHVVVIDGRMGSADEPARGRVVERFEDEPLSGFPETTQRDLLAGFPVSSLEDAERRLAQLPRQLGPQDTPTPAPTMLPGETPVPTSTLPPPTDVP